MELGRSREKPEKLGKSGGGARHVWESPITNHPSTCVVVVHTVVQQGYMFCYMHKERHDGVGEKTFRKCTGIQKTFPATCYLVLWSMAASVFWDP